MPQLHARSDSSSSSDPFIPTRLWQLAEACGLCGRGFHVLRGRHHCRHCGASVCSKHSRNRAVVPSSLSLVRQRVCDACFPACQRGVTRRRRKTVAARTISLRFEDDDDGGDNGRSACPAATALMQPKVADYESTTTTVATSTTSSTAPASVVFSAPPGLPTRKASPKQPVKALAAAAAAATTDAPAMTRDDYTARQRQLHDQQLLERRNQRSRASTVASKPTTLRQRVDSVAHSSSSSCSFSSLEDHSSSDDSSDSDCSDDEELIAKYLRRGVPLRSLSSATVSSGCRNGGTLRKDSTSAPLEAIAEKQSLETAPSVYSKQLSQPLHVTSRTRVVSSASTVSTVTDSEERADGSDDGKLGDAEWHAHGRCSGSSGACDEPVAVATTLCAPLTPPSRLNLQAVAFAYSTAIKTKAATVWNATPTVEQQPRTPETPPYTPPRTPKTLPRTPPGTPPGTPPRTNQLVAAAQRKHTATPVSPVPQPPPAAPTTPEYQPTEHDKRVMREIAALELEIQKHQSELPALLDALQQSERAAARLRDEVLESQLRVQQYRQAERVVNRSMRNARALMDEREFQAAILELLRASGIDRSSAAVWHLLAECRLHVSQLEEAEQACRKCMRLQQQQRRSVCASAALLGRILQQQGRSDEAVACYLAALERT